MITRTKIHVKPLSVNECFKGRRFRTSKYDNYEKEVLWLLPALKLPEKPYLLNMTVGFSTELADIDNIIKPFLDILQKRYKFNDRHIMKIVIEKEIVKKGKEFIEFQIEHYGLSKEKETGK